MKHLAINHADDVERREIEESSTVNGLSSIMIQQRVHVLIVMAVVIWISNVGHAEAAVRKHSL